MARLNRKEGKAHQACPVQDEGVDISGSEVLTAIAQPDKVVQGRRGRKMAERASTGMQ
jgi:hypothetical protein